MTIAIVVLLWIVSVVVAARLGRRKHRRGVVYGVFLSWIGYLIGIAAGFGIGVLLCVLAHWAMDSH